MTASPELKPETRARIDAELTRFPRKASAMMNVLHHVQDDPGCIPEALYPWLAQTLEVPEVQVHEVVTFYHGYKSRPLGKVNVIVCRTLSCALCGGYRVMEQLEAGLGVKEGHTSEDGNFSIEWGECLGSCGTGPVVHVNGALYENVTPESVEGLLETIKAAVDQPIDTNPPADSPAYFG